MPRDPALNLTHSACWEGGGDEGQQRSGHAHILPQLFSGEVRSPYIDANKGVNSCDQKLHQSPLIGSSTTLQQSCACLISSIYLSSLFIIVYIDIVASSVFTHHSCVNLICFYLISILFLTHGMLNVYYI